MSQRFHPFQPSQPEPPALAPAGEATVYTHPDDVASDPKLTTAEKRAVLASWISDARAVENAPALRRLDSGAVVEVDAIQRVLVSLDEPASYQRYDRKQPPFHRRPRVISRWLSRVGLRNGSGDDDDPPPAPAGFGTPYRPTFVAAHGARPNTLQGLALATG